MPTASSFFDVIAQARASSSEPLSNSSIGGYGARKDGTAKGDGYFGVLKRPDGNVSTELSIGVDVDGKEMEIPTIVPTLTKEELDSLLSGSHPNDQIVSKAVNFARQRIEKGLSPFAYPGERHPMPK